MRTRSTIVLTLFALLTAGLAFSLSDGQSASRIDAPSIESDREEEATEVAGEAQRVRSDEVVRLDCYGAPVGSLFGFAFRFETEYSLEILEGHGDAVGQVAGEKRKVPVLGHLDLQVVAREGEEITMFVQGRDIKTPVAGSANELGANSLRACRESLQRGFLVRIDPRGRVLGYGFENGYRASDRNFVRAVVAAFFHTVADDTTRPTWQANGSDATGDYLADYRRVALDPLTIERTKVRYTKMGRETSVPQHKVSGRSTARFDATTGFLDRVVVADRMQMDVVEFPSRLHVAIEARFECVSAARAEVTVDLAAWPGFVSASGALEDLAVDAQANEAAKWRAALTDVSFEQLLGALRALIEAGDTRSQAFYVAWERLSWKLRLDPKSVAAAQELLLQGALAENTGSMLLSALGNAGSSEAQDALLAVYGANQLDGGWRESAAISMFQLRQPTTRVLETVAARLQGLRQIDQLDATSMLMFGAIAGRGQEPLSNGRSALEQLLSLERRAADLNASGLWLDALGNAAVPAVAPHAARYLKHTDAVVRESAVVALDRSNAKGVADALLVIAKKDPVRDVRLRAIEALGKRANEVGRALLRDVAVKDADVGVRRAAIQALVGRESLSSADRRTLQQIARSDKVAELRAAATQLLATRRS